MAEKKKQAWWKSDAWKDPMHWVSAVIFISMSAVLVTLCIVFLVLMIAIVMLIFASPCIILGSVIAGGIGIVVSIVT